MRRLLLTRTRLGLALAALLCGGCFVFDELEQGEKLMEHHSSAGSSDESNGSGESTGGEKEGPGAFERVRRAFGKMTGTAKDLAGGVGEALQGSGPEPDPEGLVRCRVGGRLVFTRRVDCTNRGGVAEGEAVLRRLTRPAAEEPAA